MTRRALELLDLRRPSLILDVGCGSGLSGSILSETGLGTGSEEEDEDDDNEDNEDNGEGLEGESTTSDSSNAIPNNPNTQYSSASMTRHSGPHTWIGLDISASMLSVALEREVEGDLLLADAGQGIPFRPGTFDAAISISAIQWLCTVDGTNAATTHNNTTSSDFESASSLTNSTSAAAASAVRAPLRRFFTGLRASLRQGARAVCQFYPRDAKQRDLICGEAVKAGFRAGVLEDDPGSKHVKLYLVLSVGGSREDDEEFYGSAATKGAGGRKGTDGTGDSRDITGVVRGMDNVDVVDGRKGAANRKKGKASGWERDGKERKGSRSWILRKKAQMERKGNVVKPSSKYTGRKRKVRF